MFILDFIFCFFEEYQDNETYKIISEPKKISIKYLKGSALFDFLAIIPFQLVNFNKPKIEGQNVNHNLLRLFKLLRIPRLFGLLNIEKVKRVISDYYK